jgi:DNA modification methylase
MTINKLILGDNLDILRQIEDNSVNLICSANFLPHNFTNMITIHCVTKTHLNLKIGLSNSLAEPVIFSNCIKQHKIYTFKLMLLK